MTPGEALDQRIGAIEKRLQTVHDRVSGLESRGEAKPPAGDDLSIRWLAADDVVLPLTVYERLLRIEKAARVVCEWDWGDNDDEPVRDMVALRSALDGEG